MERHLADEGRYPVSVGLVVWGTTAMRTGGDDVAEAMSLLGVRPVWAAESGRVSGVERIPDEELERPRVDVVLRISGFFRDAFPHLIALLDEAVELAGFADGDPRIFGAKPGAYGSGILPLLDSRNWRSDEDLAEVYTAWSGYSYGRSGMGVPAAEAMRRRFARIEVAVKNQDNREHDIFDSDDYLQDHGGMIATIRVLSGRDPKALFGDSANPSAPRVRSLQEEAARVVRTRVLNPKWISAMTRHGYKGAFELAATVDYLFGYDATAHVVEDWMYERVTQAYVGDPDIRKFLEASNPWALQSMAERLLEAHERGLWAASDAALSTLRSAILEAEGWEEGRRRRPPFLPFTAVVGQDEAKLALLLAASEARIGGVLLRGDKGSAKSTLARGLADLLPGDAPFVDLPVSATEDRVVGTLDLAVALTGGEKRFDPGLLHAAHLGVLYVDEINLLPDHLVDVLLDVAASGINRVEREGVSHAHPSRFVLVGSMNPEEGELRPQLLDRFGLAVDVRTPTDGTERVAALRRRLAFDADPQALRTSFAAEQSALAGRLGATRPARVPEQIIEAVAGLCAAAGAEGLRADLTICRAAAALAGWEGRSVVEASDVRRVAPLALAHRARRDPLDPPGHDEERLEQALDANLGPAPAEPPSDSPTESPTERRLTARERGQPIPARDRGGAELRPRRGAAADAAFRRSSTWRRFPARGRPNASDRAADDRPPPGAGAGSSGTGTRSARSRRSRWAPQCVGPHPAGPGPAPMDCGAPDDQHQLDGRSGGSRCTCRSGAGRRLVDTADARQAVKEHRQANLIVIAVDASRSMGTA